VTLQWQTVQVPFGGTIDESVDTFALPSPLMREIKNGRVFKTGSFDKRLGWLDHATLTTLERVLSVGDDLFTIQQRTIASGAPVRLGSVNNALGRVDYHQGAFGAYSLSEVEVLERKTIQRDVLSGDGIGTIVSSGPSFAVAANYNLAVIAWEVGAPAGLFGAAQHIIMALVIDVNTGQTIQGPIQVSNVTGNCAAPQVVLSDPATIVVLYDRAANNEIRARAYSCASRAWGVDTLLVNNLNLLQPKWDASEIVGGTGYYIAFRNLTPVVQINRCAGVASTAVGTLGEDANSGLGAVAVYAESTFDNVWVAWYDNTNGLRAAIRQASSPATVVLAPTTMEGPTDAARQISIAPGVGSTSGIIWTTNATNTITTYGRKLLKFRSLTTAGVKGAQAQISDVELISKAFACSNGFTYAAVLYDGSDVDGTQVLGMRSFSKQVAFTMCLYDTADIVSGNRATSFRCAATWAQGEAGRKRLPSSLSAFRELIVNGELEQWWALAPEFDLIPITAGTDTGAIVGRPGVDLCRQRITNIPPIFAARIGDNVVFSGGVPQVWDGVALQEYGFLVPPENGKAVAAGSGGNLTAGQYGAELVFEYRLATGDIVQSAPALVHLSPTATNIPTVANDKITITAPTLNLTRKWQELSNAGGSVCRAYRTEANGTIYYAEGDFTVSSGFANAYPGPVALSITVQQADAAAIQHRKVYTHGDILENWSPPALSYIHTHRNRLFGISAENRKKVVFTHTYDAGELPGWHPDLVIDVPDECVALATIDEKLVILCKNGIYLITGDGPDRKGLNSDYQEPFHLNSPHGCISAESVVTFPNGIIYQATTGFCLMNRKTDIARVGGNVEDTVSAFPFTLASLVVPDKEFIYWAMADARTIVDSFDGRTIVYDWAHNVWSVDQIGFPNELGTAFTFHTSFAVTPDGVFSTIQASPLLYREEGYADPGGQWIYTELKTAMLNPGSTQAFTRARWLSVLGTRLGVHDLTVKIDTFHHPTGALPLSQSFTWPDAATGALFTYALKMHLRDQTAAFCQVTIADGPKLGSPAGASASFTGLALELGLKKQTPQMAQIGMR